MSAWGSAYLGCTQYACTNIPRHSPIEVVHEGLEEFANRVVFGFRFRSSR